MMDWLTVVIVSFIAGVMGGWIQAHDTVATECERLGSFYVGKDVFHCAKFTKFGEEE